MNRCRLLALAFVLAAGAADAATITVGAGAAVHSLADAVHLARDGDTILVQGGEYRGDVAVVHQRQLTIRGLGPRPVLIADGQHAEGKAILVVRDGDVVIENLEFRGARVPDGNGAGIRFEKGRLTVRRCAFIDNQNGLLSANFEDAELRIEDSEFAQAPRDRIALHHLLYVGRIALLQVTGSRFHQGYNGHLLKSRARRTELSYNLLHDGDDGRASYEVDLPNGGDVLLIGNVIGQSAQSENDAVVAYGAEGRPWPHSRLRMAHNTLTSAGPGPATFLRVWPDRLTPGTTLTAINNLSLGVGVFAPVLPGKFRGNQAGSLDLLVDASALDFRLVAGSRLRSRGVDPRDGVDVDLAPTAEPTLPVGSRALPDLQRWSPGAFQR